MKSIQPIKIIISFNEHGELSDNIILYKKYSVNGELSPKTQSISIRSIVNVPLLNQLIKDAIEFAKKQEGLNG